ncbi:MAG: hypothetical protein AB7S26_03575 [Sandaracinaceae bacterium]
MPDLRRLATILAFLFLGVGCDDGAEGTDGGRAGTDAGADVDAGGSSDRDAGAAPSDAGDDPDAGPRCPAPEGAPAITGATHMLAGGGDLAALVGTAASGDEIVLADGTYGDVTITDDAFDGWLVIRAAPGATPRIASLHLTNTVGLYFEGVTFEGQVLIEAAERTVLDHIRLDIADRGDPTMYPGGGINVSGRGVGRGNRDFVLRNSTIRGGRRTLFLHSLFVVPDEWNQNLVIQNNELDCVGDRNCIQISGSQHVLIADNTFRSAHDGVLMAGAIDVQVLRNRFEGTASSGSAGGAVRVASPGYQWDAFDGVGNMVSTDVLVANNLVRGYGTGVELAACRRVDVVFNTVMDGRGLSTWHRVPVDENGDTVLVGNDEYRVWNNVLGEIRIDGLDPRPTFESNNAAGTGGMGAGLITSDPLLDAEGIPMSGSPLIDAALVHADNPTDDLLRADRTGPPDIGGVEVGATVACP